MWNFVNFVSFTGFKIWWSEKYSQVHSGTHLGEFRWKVSRGKVKMGNKIFTADLLNIAYQYIVTVNYLVLL